MCNSETIDNSNILYILQNHKSLASHYRKEMINVWEGRDIYLDLKIK